MKTDVLLATPRQTKPTPPARDERTGLWTWGERADGRGYWIGSTVAEEFAVVWRTLLQRGRRGEARANARMMAHAPELVERIRAISKAQAHEDDASPSLLEAIDAALETADKAEGLK